MKRLKPEHIAALVAILATAYVGLHKLYKELETKPVIIKGPENDLGERAIRRMRGERRRGWPCAYQVILGELVIVGVVVLVVLLTSRP